MVYSVQYLRGLAALLVVIAHVLHKYNQSALDPWQAFTVGGAGVDLFFIISGFVMCHAGARSCLRPLAFLRARAVRILPLYWLLSLLALTVYLINPAWVNSSGGTTTLLHSFTLYPVGEKLLNQNGWTLSYEFFFYFMFALTLLLQRQVRLPILVIILLGLVGYGLLFEPQAPASMLATNPLLLEFAAGCLAYTTSRRWQLSPLLCVALILAGVCALLYANGHPDIHARVLLWGIPMFCLFTGSVGLEPLLAKHHQTLAGRLLKQLGDASYSLYLVHPFVVSGSAMALKKAGMAQHPWAMLTLMTAASLLAGHLCYRQVEVPLLKRLRDRRSENLLHQVIHSSE